MKHWYTTLAATGVCCAAIAAAAFASQPQHRVPDRAELQKKRAELRQNAKPRTQSPLRIMGGTDGTKPLCGLILNDDYVYSYEGAFVGFSGPVEIKGDAAHVKLAPSKEIKASSGCYYDGTVVAIYRDFEAKTPYGEGLVSYSFYDAETWQSVGAGVASYTFTSKNVYPTDITYDPTTKRLYGSFVENTAAGWSTGANFGYLDLTKEFENWTSPVQIIADFGVEMAGIACSADGTLFGIGTDNALYTINKMSGVLTKIGDIDFTYEPESHGYASAEIDWETGDIYYFYQDVEYDTYIVKIDPVTAKSTLIANFSAWNDGTYTTDNFPVLFFKQKAAQSASTPAKVENLAVTADGVLNAANISFEMPSVDTDGNDLSGNIDWKVSVGSEVVASGNAAPGAKVETRVEMAEGGLTTFVVYAQSGDNEGTPIASTVFIGNDTPMLPGSPLVSTNGSDVQIVWDEAVGVHREQGGNLADVTYRIVRLPDNKIVADAATGLSATDKIESVYKTLYSYAVTPVSGAIEGEPRSTRPFYAGEVFGLPHTEDFSDELRFNQYPSIDANKDGNTWWIDAPRKRAVYSSESVKADDYLCIGPFDMKAGAKYNFSMDADGHSVPEKVSVWAGTDKTDGSSYTHEIVPSTFLRPAMGESHLSGSFVPETDGRYYFAVKAESDANMQNIYLFNVKVTETGNTCPAAPADLSATPCDEGMRLSCTLPALTLGGDKADITGVCITRDNQIIAETKEGVADGVLFTWIDKDAPSDGEHVYSVMAVNAAGTGDAAVCTAWWGPDRPGTPENMRVYQDIDDPTVIHVTWDAPEYGIHGGILDPAGIDWVIDWMSLGSVGSGMKHVGSACLFDLKLTPEQCAEQNIVAFTVYGVNAAGSSDRDGKMTRSGYFGPALNLPFRESWTGFTQKGIWSGESLKDKEELFESYWDMSNGQNFGVLPQDDDCMYALTTTVPGGGYRVRSPRMAISGEKNPSLVFYLLYTADARDFEVEIAVNDRPMSTLRAIEIEPSKYGQWQRVEISLADYKDSKYFQLGFKGHGVKAASGFCCIDNLSVLDLNAKDLTAVGIAGPKKAEFNEPVEIAASFRNSGSSAVKAGDYKVRLVKNGKTVAEKDGVALAPDTNGSVAFSDSPTPADPEDTEYRIEIVFDGDENLSDNTGEVLPVRIVRSIFPTVNDLTGDTKTGVTLRWSEPAENEILPEYTVEDFDSYTAFTVSELGDWKTYDADGAPTVVLSTALGVLNYPNIGTPMAWQVIDPLEANIFLSSWTPRSGSNMLVSFQACNDNNNREKASGDWLISPELYGGPQSVSFYACSGMGGDYAPEIMDIMYSTTGTDVKDFIPLAENVEVGYDAADWTEFSFNLPEGARYFAIVHKSYNKVALMIDDVKYIAAGSERRPLTLLGYNVYRDGVKINAAPVGENTYDDVDVETGKEYVYHVSVVWDKGESVLSNEFKAKAGSGVSDIYGAAIRISIVPGAIRVAGAAGMPVEVYTTSGMRVAGVASASETVDFNVGAGIYIVRTPGKSLKVKVD